MKQIAKMFETSKQNVNYHVKAFLKELDDEQVSSVVKESFTIEKNGRHEGFTQINQEEQGFKFNCCHHGNGCQ